MTNSNRTSQFFAFGAALFFCFLVNDTSLFAQKTETLLASNVAIQKSYKEQNSIPKSLQRKLKRDAARLALRMEAKKEDLRYQNIFIPRANMENIYNVLSSIYLQDETAQSIAKCNVHTFPNPSIDHVVITFDRNVEWAAPLRDGISETDSEEINELLEEYDLIIEKHVQWNDTEDAITIRSKGPLNMAALANEFYNVDGVNTIDLGIPSVGGNDINIFRKAEGWEVQYVLRFGSYISGDGKIHIWTYMATDEGEVRFISETGDPVPEWMRCHFEWQPLVSKG
ncbi:MAG: hypothetical protein AB8F74_10180 [Saprospiraceae bacterium]